LEGKQLERRMISSCGVNDINFLMYCMLLESLYPLKRSTAGKKKIELKAIN
jgi:hypothetical protein